MQYIKKSTTTFILICTLTFSFFLLINVNFVYAKNRCECQNKVIYTVNCDNCPSTCTSNASYGVFVSCSAGGASSGGPVKLENPLGKGQDNPSVLIGKVINAVLGIVGSLALVMFIYGGFTWMLAAGNKERVQKGKDVLVWAVIGLVVIFSAYALVRLVFRGLGA